MKENDSSNLVKIGALWKGKTKAGDPMLSGKMGDARLIVFKNGYKKENKHPDFIVYVTQNKRDEDDSESENGDFFNSSNQKTPPIPDGYKLINGKMVKVSEARVDEDIPF